MAVFGASDGVMPHRLAQGAAALEEERRVFHVAITRGIGGWRCWPTPPARRRSWPSSTVTPRPRSWPRPSGPPAPTPRPSPPPRAGRSAAAAGAKAPPPTASGPEAARVEQALRAWRKERSQADGVPAYVVLNDRHLVGIAERRPATTRELSACPGIGPAKLAAYGDELLALVAAATATGEPADGNGYSE